MKKFLISHDLKKADWRDYRRIETLLTRYNAKQVLINVWLYKSFHSFENAENIRDSLLNFIDPNIDRLIVVELNDWASCNSITPLQ